MPSRRMLKAAEAIREVVSMAILTDMKDPRVDDVTVTRVEVTADMRQAKVHVSIMGNETKEKLCLAGLRSAAGYLQAKINSRIDTRYTPKLEFVIDKGVKQSIAIAEILSRVLPKSEPNAGQENKLDASTSDQLADEADFTDDQLDDELDDDELDDEGDDDEEGDDDDDEQDDDDDEDATS